MGREVIYRGSDEDYDVRNHKKRVGYYQQVKRLCRHKSTRLTHVDKLIFLKIPDAAIFKMATAENVNM